MQKWSMVENLGGWGVCKAMYASRRSVAYVEHCQDAMHASRLWNLQKCMNQRHKQLNDAVISISGSDRFSVRKSIVKQSCVETSRPKRNSRRPRNLSTGFIPAAKMRWCVCAFLSHFIVHSPHSRQKHWALIVLDNAHHRFTLLLIVKAAYKHTTGRPTRSLVYCVCLRSIGLALKGVPPLLQNHLQ